jgi:hypothetical protein
LPGPNFEVFVNRRNRPTMELAASLHASGTLGITRGAFEALGSPEAVELLYDAEQHIIGLRPADPSLPHVYRLRHPPGSASYYLSIAALARQYRIDVTRRLHLAAQMIGDTLAIDLKQQEGDRTKAKTRSRDAQLATAH